MVQDPKLRFALALCVGRLHKAHGDKRCGCGPCAHWVAVAAKWAGVPRQRLEAALPAPAKPEPRRRRRPQSMRGRSASPARSASVGAISTSRRASLSYSAGSTIRGEVPPARVRHARIAQTDEFEIYFGTVLPKAIEHTYDTGCSTPIAPGLSLDRQFRRGRGVSGTRP